jgi:hypothetical protein
MHFRTQLRSQQKVKQKTLTNQPVSAKSMIHLVASEPLQPTAAEATSR